MTKRWTNLLTLHSLLVLNFNWIFSCDVKIYIQKPIDITAAKHNLGNQIFHLVSRTVCISIMSSTFDALFLKYAMEGRGIMWLGPVLVKQLNDETIAILSP